MAQEKILIVEDEANIRTGLAEMIAGWGYRTESAADGVEGLEKARAWSPAVILLDLQMPRMSGSEMMGQLAADSQEFKVVVVSANRDVPTVVELMKLGAYDYLNKPVDTRRLRQILQNATSSRDTEV